MKKIPLFKMFPVSDDIVTEQEMKNYQDEKAAGFHPRPLRSQIIVNTPLDFVKHCLLSPAFSGVVRNFEIALDHFLAKLQSSGEFVDNMLPIFHDYQNTYETVVSNRLTELNKAILTYGCPLSVFQCLFHGGTFPYKLGYYRIDNPLSTTFAPNVAIEHAHRQNVSVENPYDSYNRDATVLILIVPPFCTKKAILYYSAGDSMGHEYEVLIESGVTIRTVHKEKLINYRGETTDVMIGYIF